MRVKQEKGITLIALVVTIIILIILAGVSINLVLGDNGIITKAKQAKGTYSQAQAREKIEIVLEEAKIDKFTNEKYNQNEYLDEMILNKVPNSKVNGDIVISDGYGFTIDRSIPAIVDYVGKEEDLVFPDLITNVTIQPDRKTATIEITATEEENGIKKIELLQDGFVVQAYSYEGEEIETTKTETLSVPRNGKYTVKVTSLLSASKIVTITDLVSSITYSPNGSSIWKKEYQVRVTAKENTDRLQSIKYQWTDTPNEPSENTFSKVVENNGVITENTLTGKYYLWTLLEDSSGDTRIEKSELFYFDNTAPTAEITTEWLDENEVSSLKISVSNIKDEHSGIDNNSIKIYVTPENGTKEEKKINLADGEGNIIIDGLRQESLTTIELPLIDYAENIREIKRSVGRFYIVKDGKIKNGETFTSYEGNEWIEDQPNEVSVSILSAGNLGTFGGVLVDLPEGYARLYCNIIGASRSAAAGGEATRMFVYSGDNYEIYNPPGWPSYTAGINLCEYESDIAVPNLYFSELSEVGGRCFVGFFQCGHARGIWKQRVISLSDMYLDYE